MAQKTNKEETELKVPETLALCTQPLSIPSSTISSPDNHRTSPDPPSVDFRPNSATSPEHTDPSKKRPSEAVQPSVNRCSGCNRKLRLLGFRCRCGDMFCSDHRYSDRHDCSYDYKAAGREAIARENPVVRAAKILKV